VEVFPGEVEAFAEGLCAVHLTTPLDLPSPTTLLRKGLNIWDHEIQLGGEGPRASWKFVWGGHKHEVVLIDRSGRHPPFVSISLDGKVLYAKAPDLSAQVWRYSFSLNVKSDIAKPVICTLLMAIDGDDSYTLLIDDKPFRFSKEMLDLELVQKQAAQVSQGLTPVKTKSESRSKLKVEDEEDDPTEPTLASRKYVQSNWVREDEELKSKLGLKKHYCYMEFYN